MIRKTLLFLAFFLLLGLVFTSLSTASAAANYIPPSHLTSQSFGVDANALKPPQCAGINLTTILVGSGRIKGKNRDELILGSPLNDTITSGKKGDDCILGGGGDDDITGNGSTSICIGGPGNDTFHDCAIAIQ